MYFENELIPLFKSDYQCNWINNVHGCCFKIRKCEDIDHNIVFERLFPGHQCQLEKIGLRNSSFMGVQEAWKSIIDLFSRELPCHQCQLEKFGLRNSSFLGA